MRPPLTVLAVAFALVAVEQYPVKMLALITEINDLLEAKEERLKRERAADPYTRGGEC